MMLTRMFFFTALLGPATTLAEAGGYDEFLKPTVDFAKIHVMEKGDRICVDREDPYDPPVELKNCYTLTANTKVLVKYVIHGVNRPQFFVEPVNPALKHGWVYREQITD